MLKHLKHQYLLYLNKLKAPETPIPAVPEHAETPETPIPVEPEYVETPETPIHVGHEHVENT